MSSNWRYYDKDLDHYERELDAVEYQALAEDPAKRSRVTRGFFTVDGSHGITLESLNGLLAGIKPPFGYGVLTPLPLPAFPSSPTRPNTPIPPPPPQGLLSIFAKAPPPDRSGFSPAILEKEARLETKTENKRREFKQKYANTALQLTEIRANCEADDLNAVRFMLNLIHARHSLPTALHLPIDFQIDQPSRILLCSIEIPDFAQLHIVKKRAKSYDTVPVTSRERKAANETLLYSLALERRSWQRSAMCGIGSIRLRSTLPRSGVIVRQVRRSKASSRPFKVRREISWPCN